MCQVEIDSLIIGLILIPIGEIFRRSLEYLKINKCATIRKGITIEFPKCRVNIKIGRIEKITNGSTDAVVILPANTSFIDDCINDKGSALGSYLSTHYGERALKINGVMKKELKKSGYSLLDGERYPIGTSIILPSPYDLPLKVIITAVTNRVHGIGIIATPSGISKCIEEIFKISADKKISRIYLPLIGSGHGGLDKYDTLVFLVLAIKHASESHHHIREANILIRNEDEDEFKEAYRIQYLRLVAKTKR